MFTPTKDTAIQRPDLGQALYEVISEAPGMGYIGLAIMTPFYTASNSQEFPVIPKEALFNVEKTTRGPKGTYNRKDRRFESGFFKTSENGLEEALDDRFTALYASLFEYETVISRALMQDILRAQEVRIATKIFNTTNFPATNAAVNWNTSATTKPKADVNTGKNVLRKKGVMANTLILPYEVFLALQKADDVKTVVFQLFPDAAKDGNIGISHLRTYFDIDNILIAGALKNDAGLGKDANLVDIWDSGYAMLARIAPAGSDISEPSIGRTFIWNEGARETVIVEEYREESVRGMVLRVRHDTDEALLVSYDDNKTVKSNISQACGYLIDVTP